MPPITPPATFVHRDSVATPHLTYLRLTPLSSSPWHGLALLHDSFTAICIADTPLMFLNLTSLILTTDGRCACMNRPSQRPKPYGRQEKKLRCLVLTDSWRQEV